MRYVLSVLLLLACARGVFAKPCAEESAQVPCTPSASEKRVVLDAIKLVIDKRGDAITAEKSWQDARERREGDKEIELSLFEARERASNDFNAAAAHALDVIRVAYRIDPPFIYGNVQKPDPSAQGLDWTEGMSARWHPEVALNEAECRKFVARDRSLHYMCQDNISVAGLTSLGDGRVMISYQELIQAYRAGNPGIVAATLFHESMHFLAMITTGISSLEQNELGAYTVEADHIDTFELSGTDYAQLIVSERDRLRAIVDQGGRTPYGLLPEEEAAAKGIFDEDEFSRLELAKYYEGLKAEVERIKRDKLEREQEEDRLRREAERRSLEHIRAEFLAEVERQVRACGFEPRYDGDSREIVGFKTAVRGWPASYTIVHETSMDEFKTALMFARACLDVTMEGVEPRNASPCGEGFALANQYWRAPGFKDDTTLNVEPEAQAKCFRSVHDRWDAHVDMREFARLLSRGRKEFQRRVDDDWRREERERRRQEDAERRARDDQRQRDRSDDRDAPDRGYNHPRAPTHCGFNSGGAYCH